MQVISNTEIYCEEHGTVRVPSNFFGSDFGEVVTMYCPECAAESYDMSLEELIEKKTKPVTDYEEICDDPVINYFWNLQKAGK